MDVSRKSGSRSSTKKTYLADTFERKKRENRNAALGAKKGMGNVCQEERKNKREGKGSNGGARKGPFRSIAGERGRRLGEGGRGSKNSLLGSEEQFVQKKGTALYAARAFECPAEGDLH